MIIRIHKRQAKGVVNGIANSDRIALRKDPIPDQIFKTVEQPFHAKLHSPENRCSGFSFMDEFPPVTMIGIE